MENQIFPGFRDNFGTNNMFHFRLLQDNISWVNCLQKSKKHFYAIWAQI